MSVIKSATIACDHIDCADDDESASWLGHYETAAQVRYAAKQQGWTRRGGKDYCPRHSDFVSTEAHDGQ